MFCALDDLQTESDVEQKLLFPLLTAPLPTGLALQPVDILTKRSIRRLEIGKGVYRKLYYPDYVVAIAGLPLLIIEAKAPGESVAQGLAEARLYANEVNALFPTGTNPCIRVIASNGAELVSSPIDTASPDVALVHADLSAGHLAFAHLLDLCARHALQSHADAIRRSLRRDSYKRPTHLVGGSSFQSEELPQNTFGATIVGDYGHIFNPKSREDRAFVVRHAYVPSLRRQRYVEPIDRLIRNSVTPATAAIPILGNSAHPNELTATLRERKALENQVLLLVGSVGAGKSTFIDHLTLVALPGDIREKTVWLRINLNEAPLFTQVAYGWIAKAMLAEFREQFVDLDLDDVSVLEKVFAPELNTFRKGPASLLDPRSEAYRQRLTDHMIRLQTDDLRMAQCVARYLCGGPNRLLVVVLDNCDKRTRDEQLTMFQIAQWVQREFRCLVVLPIRDVTFDLHRHEPPLDTALKGLVFRIEPPPFSEVLQARVRLALEEMRVTATSASALSYQLPNGMRVTYPASDQARYLASILRSLYAHDRFVRQVMTGLAGRDVRRALELFLDFCTSGHIGEDEIFKIRLFEGKHILALSTVARVLLRMHRRFYDGDKAHIKNLMQCRPEDALPDHFVRLGVLHWLQQHQQVKGPAGVVGFHRVGDLVRALVQLGHDALRVAAELTYLIQNGLVVPEHLRPDVLDDADLIKITASGAVHLQLMANPDYLAACAEDMWLAEADLAHRIAKRMTDGGLQGQLSRLTTARNALDVVEYLRRRGAERLMAPDAYLDQAAAVELNTLREAEAAIAAAETEVSRELYVGHLPADVNEDELRKALEAAGIAPVRVEVVRDSATGRSRGYGFVQMPDGSSAMRALDVPRVSLRGRQLVLNEAYSSVDDAASMARHRRNAPAVSERLYVGNLPFAMDQAAVKDLFAANGFEPLDVFMPVDRESRRFKGFAFVTVTSKDEANRAIGVLHGMKLNGRVLRVRPADPREEKGEQ